jgi:hypothetical protein
MTLLLGILIGLTTSVIGNLVTPLIKPLWAKFLSLQQRGMQSQIRQQVKVLQTSLDQINHFRASDRDLYLYLFRWLLAIIAAFTAAVGVTLFAVARPDLRLFNFSLILFLLAITLSLVILWTCRDFTTAGMEEKTAKLERDIAKLIAKLPV